MNTVNSIDWKGPYVLFPDGEWPVIFDVDEANSPGVYLWTVEQPTGYQTLYVGMTANSIAFRQEQHVRDFLAGKYWIYEPDSLLKGEREYLGYDPKNGISAFLRDYQHLSQVIAQQLGVLRVFFAPIESEKQFIERVESSLIELFRGTTESGKKPFLENARVSRLTNKDDRISIPVTGTKNIHNMPHELEV